MYSKFHPLLTFTFQRPVGFGGSNHLLLDGFVKLRTGKDILGSFNFVDVRCAAECHVEALIRPSAGGNRILLPGHRVSWQEICELLDFFVETYFLLKIRLDTIYNDHERPIGSLKIDQSVLDSVANQPVPHQVQYSTEKSEKILGVKYRSIDVTIQDTLRAAIALGWK